MISPTLVTVTPTLSIRDASSNSFSTPMFVSPLEPRAVILGTSRFSHRHDSIIGRCGRMQNGRMGRKHGQIAPAPNLRLEVPKEGRGIACRLLEQAAEIQFIAEA